MSILFENMEETQQKNNGSRILPVEASGMGAGGRRGSTVFVISFSVSFDV